MLQGSSSVTLGLTFAGQLVGQENLLEELVRRLTVATAYDSLRGSGRTTPWRNLSAMSRSRVFSTLFLVWSLLPDFPYS